MLEIISPKDFVEGFVEVFDQDPVGKRTIIAEQHNMYMYNGADINALLTAGQVAYRLGTMYLEFENLSSPGDPITPPAYDRSGGTAYYSSLASPRDFIRVPMSYAPTIVSSDPTKYQGNQITFLGISAGIVGQHGLTFSHTVNSAVFGGALIAAPVPDTQADDLVYSRTYWADRYVLKQQNHQIGIQWTLRYI